MSSEKNNSLASEACAAQKKCSCSAELSSSTETSELSERQLDAVAGGLQVNTAINSLKSAGTRNRCESVAK